MAAAIRIRLSDLLEIMLSPLPRGWFSRERYELYHQTKLEFREVGYRKRITLISHDELEAISHYLQCEGPAKSYDLQLEFGLSPGAALRRLALLKEKGVVVDLPGHRYGLAGD